MMRRATHISSLTRTAITGAALACFASSGAAAQVIPDEPGVEDVARTPLEDFNIDSDDIPEILLAAARDPYASDGLSTCDAIVAQIALLDRALGADFDIADAQDHHISEGQIAQSVVGSFVPFRGIVREVSGANKKRQDYNMAVASGMVRRGFLKGMGQARRCAYPARPRENRGTLTRSE